MAGYRTQAQIIGFSIRRQISGMLLKQVSSYTMRGEYWRWSDVAKRQMRSVSLYVTTV
jgi:hypothetical protein